MVSTTDAYIIMEEYARLLVTKLMLDFSKAFDRMQPNIAIRKLLDININPILIRTIESCLSERSQSEIGRAHV